MRRTILPALLMAVLLVVTGCKGTASKIKGKYVQDNGKGNLEITDDKIIIAEGPMTLTFTYKVKSVAGDTATLDVTIPGKAEPEVMTVALVDKGVEIKEGTRTVGKFNRQ